MYHSISKCLRTFLRYWKSIILYDFTIHWTKHEISTFWTSYPEIKDASTDYSYYSRHRYMYQHQWLTYYPDQSLLISFFFSNCSPRSWLLNSEPLFGTQFKSGDPDFIHLESLLCIQFLCKSFGFSGSWEDFLIDKCYFYFS